MLAWPDPTEVHNQLDVLQILDTLTIRSLGFSFSSLLFTKPFICLEHKIQRKKVKSLFLKRTASICPRGEQFGLSLCVGGIWCNTLV